MTRITEAQIKQYHDEGYFILERAIPEHHLEMLRAECARYIKLIEDEMDRQGKDVIGLNHRNSRYFISNRYKESPHLADFIFSDLMAEICRATLGETAYLFHEQFVVKAAERGMKFGWHQDSGYVRSPHKPYVTCWCALDDVNEENGTVYLLPYSRAGVRERVAHVQEAGTNDLIGYFGDDPGIPVIVPAGSIAVFSSVCFHRSGPNRTNKMRRIYLPQYSAEPIRSEDGTTLWAFAEPFLKDGQIVAARRFEGEAAPVTQRSAITNR
jgi:ectoine hydroxylase-related dioxygenase (phytanoyl-CoA dioxygenase family)